VNHSSQVEVGNLTISEVELTRNRPLYTHGATRLRARCPFHGSDHQRSLSLDLETGRFRCFACGAWGYTQEARERRRQERSSLIQRPSIQQNSHLEKGPSFQSILCPVQPSNQPETPARSDLHELLCSYQQALPGSLGEIYLIQRGIPLDVARRAGVGYAAPGRWAHVVRDWKRGRLIFPHTTPDGTVVNLYGRAVGGDDVPKATRHDHLPGTKGYFNTASIEHGSGPLFVCEGPFDALSLMAAGHDRSIAIFGVNGWRWEWIRLPRQLVFAFDADQAGAKWRELARQATILGKKVAFITPEDYGGHKDVNEAWKAGVLAVGDWPFVDTAN
jgi:DNA primase